LLRCREIHTKPYEDWFRNSEVMGEGEFIETQTAWRSHKRALGKQAKNNFSIFFRNHGKRRLHL
jgi:hypothetical protein